MKARIVFMSCANFRIVIILSILCFVSPVFSQNDQTNQAFLSTIRGLGKSLHATPTSEGGYVTLSERREGLHIVRKTNAAGERIWEKSLSVQIVGLYDLTAIAEINNGFVVVGYKWNVWDYDNYQFAFIILLHNDGTVKQCKVFFENGRAISFDSVHPSPDGSFIVTGYRGRPILVKFTPSGDIIWTKGFDLPSSAFVTHSTPDNGLVLADGIRDENSQFTGANLIKVDQAGNVLWQKTVNLPLPHSHIILGHSFDNGIILATKPAGINTLTLIGLRADGKFIWSANYSLRVSAFSISSVIPTEDGGYSVTGTTHVKHTGEAKDGFLIKIDHAQNLILTKTFGYPNIRESGRSVFATNASSYFLIGSSNSNLLLVNLNPKGALPGCNFFRKLEAKRLDSPEITISTSNITVSSPTFAVPQPTTLIQGDSRRRSTNICQ